MSKIIKILKKVFNKNETIDLFSNNNEPALAELGGNYCEDLC